MALGIQISTGGDGEFKQHVKYDARAGRMFRVDRSKDAAGNWMSSDVDITSKALFVADMANIKVGWINFAKTGPVKILVPVGQPFPARPEGVDDKGRPAFRQGFEMNIVLHPSCASEPNGAREFSSCAGCVITAVDGLHDAYSSAPESRAGKLPVVRITETVPVKSGESTNYQPRFHIEAWVDRPAPLSARGLPAAATPAPAPAAAAFSPPPAPVSPPPVPQPASADAYDFG